MTEYVFTCTNHNCICHKTTIAFTTDNITEAEKHSRENNSPMWVARKDLVK